MIDSERTLARIAEQVLMGPRYCGADGHAQVQAWIADRMDAADSLRVHAFEESFFGFPQRCKNIWARFTGEREGRILLGAHYDTRPRADRDANPAMRDRPVPGANDGASGPALFIELARDLLERRERPTVDLVFFDAEDWHGIDGKSTGIGSKRFVEQLAPEERPDAMFNIDMVAGRGLMLDLDVRCQQHDPSYQLTLQTFQLGRSLGLDAFSLRKQHPYKWITSDHTAFMEAGIPSALLLDIDYGPWHTIHDTLEACDARSLEQMGQFLESLVFGWGAEPAA